MALGVAVAALLSIAAVESPAALPAPLYPPDTRLTPIPTPRNVERPPYLNPILETSLGTTITRISDRSAFDQPGATSIRHANAKNQPWNADGSLLMLDYHDLVMAVKDSRRPIGVFRCYARRNRPIAGIFG
jgi:hypothetical protein